MLKDQDLDGKHNINSLICKIRSGNVKKGEQPQPALSVYYCASM